MALYAHEDKLVVYLDKLADGERCCCCRPPDITKVLNKSTPIALTLSGTYYLFKGGFFTENISDHAGFHECVEELYSCNLTIASGTIDDYGEIAGVSLDTHRPCETRPDGSPQLGTGDLTTITTPVTVPVEFVQKDDGTFVVPVEYEAISSNCGPPTGLNVTLVFSFVGKV